MQGNPKAKDQGPSKAKTLIARMLSSNAYSGSDAQCSMLAGQTPMSMLVRQSQAGGAANTSACRRETLDVCATANEHLR